MDRRKQLLVIDDDPNILQVLKANLELYGFETALAATWSEAQRLLGAQLPDLIILDLTLPDGDGLAICRELKRDCPKVPIIMLTAKDRVSDKVVGLESGADDYIVKPFETLELIARIKVCLRRSQPAQEVTRVGDLVVDAKSRTARVRGTVVDLTRKEFELLRLFAANRGETLTRDYIRKTLWKGTKIYTWSRVIDVHIQHLRQKIEQNPLDPRLIVTVPGVGYKLQE
jgi:DNA-binding response OmpR family regulator